MWSSMTTCQLEMLKLPNSKIMRPKYVVHLVEDSQFLTYSQPEYDQAMAEVGFEKTNSDNCTSESDVAKALNMQKEAEEQCGVADKEDLVQLADERPDTMRISQVSVTNLLVRNSTSWGKWAFLRLLLFLRGCLCSVAAAKANCGLGNLPGKST